MSRPFVVMLFVVLVLMGIAASCVDAVFGAAPGDIPPVVEPTPVVQPTIEPAAVDYAWVLWLPMIEVPHD